MYEDKLDGKIDDEFRTRKMNEWREQERRLESEWSRFKVGVTEDIVLTAKYILEPANQAHFLYLTRSHAERALLLKRVAFELRHGWRKPLDDLQILVRSDF